MTEEEIAKRESTCNLLMDVALGQGLLVKIDRPTEERELSPSSSSSSSSLSAAFEPTLAPHPLDIKYLSLDCDLVEVAEESEVFQVSVLDSCAD